MITKRFFNIADRFSKSLKRTGVVTKLYLLNILTSNRIVKRVYRMVIRRIIMEWIFNNEGEGACKWVLTNRSHVIQRLISHKGSFQKVISQYQSCIKRMKKVLSTTIEVGSFSDFGPLFQGDGSP